MRHFKLNYTQIEAFFQRQIDEGKQIWLKEIRLNAMWVAVAATAQAVAARLYLLPRPLQSKESPSGA